jgi:glycerol-3-phosphate dehydrogenase
MAEPGWFDVAGGKLTTYRLMAQQAVDRVGRHLGRNLGPCATASTPLAAPTEDFRYSGVLPPPVAAEVVEHCCRQEWVRHLDDLLVRRTSWHHYYRDQGPMVEQVSRWMARTLGWNERCRLAEVERHQNAAGAAAITTDRGGSICRKS